MSRKSRALALAFAGALLSLMAFASAAQAVPATFWGVVPQAVPTEEQWETLKAGGVDSVRMPVDWSEIQPTRGGALNLAEIDALVKRTSQAGIEVLPFITNAPKWAVPSANVPGTGGAVKAPAHLPVAGSAATAWASMLKGLVARYGPNGSLWAENPTVPKRPIRNWQIWNEENFRYFDARPNPVEYGKLVKNSFTALRSADAGAQVILGGMFARPKGGRRLVGKKVANPSSPDFFASYFLSQVYKTNPGIKTSFQGVALHPYTGKYQELTPEIEEVRSILAANKDAAKGLWITELGWSSQPPPANPLQNIFAKGVKGQAQQLRGAFTLLSAKAAKWHLKRVYWFSVDDQVGACNFCDGSGLFGEGFVAKPSWTEFTKFAGGTP